MNAAESLLRRYLRQRGELGDREIVLDRLTVAELGALLVPRSTPEARLEPPAAAPAPNPERTAVSTAAARAVIAPPVAARPAPPTTSAPAPPPPVVPVNPAAVEGASFEQLRDLALACAGCDLCGSRSTVVFGEGDPAASVMIVGEAPGAEEDRTGRPFVGRAGKLLDRFLESVGFGRESVYICNVLKCRPPGNRNPTPEEIAACSPYLRRQVELVDPKVILAVGTFPAQTLLGTTETIGRLRGRVHDFEGRPLIPTYHPAAVLRNPSWIRPVWDDLQRLRAVLEAA